METSGSCSQERVTTLTLAESPPACVEASNCEDLMFWIRLSGYATHKRSHCQSGPTSHLPWSSRRTVGILSFSVAGHGWALGIKDWLMKHALPRNDLFLAKRVLMVSALE